MNSIGYVEQWPSILSSITTWYEDRTASTARKFGLEDYTSAFQCYALDWSRCGIANTSMLVAAINKVRGAVGGKCRASK